MAMSQAAEMPSSIPCFLCLLVLVLSGVNSLTLHLHPEQRYMLPQNRGFFTIEANENSSIAGGGGAAGSVLPLAARRSAEGASGSGAQPQPRSRRSSGKSAMPKVYGQVICASLCCVLSYSNQGIT